MGKKIEWRGNDLYVDDISIGWLDIVCDYVFAFRFDPEFRNEDEIRALFARCCSDTPDAPTEHESMFTLKFVTGSRALLRADGCRRLIVRSYGQIELLYAGKYADNVDIRTLCIKKPDLMDGEFERLLMWLAVGFGSK